MGHRSSVYAIRPPRGKDERFVHMKAVWDACAKGRDHREDRR